MYCPRCGQEQVSREIRFCSRCGLPLNLVAEVVSYNGTLPQLEELAKSKSLFTRRNGLIFTLFWFLFFVFILTPLFGIADIDEMAGVAAILGTMGGLILMIASFTLLKKEPKLNKSANPRFAQSEVRNLNEARQSALPPQQSIPVSSYAPPPAGSWQSNTEDLQPTSVTEDTTKLLNKNE